METTAARDRPDPKLAHVAAQWPAARPIVCCRFEPTGQRLFCGLESSSIARFDLADGKKIVLEGGHHSWVFSLAFSPEGQTAYSGGGDGRVAVWEAAAPSPRPTRTFTAHQGWIRALGVSPDGRLLATGGNDRAVRVWKTSGGAALHELKGHPGHVYSLEFHPGKHTLFSGDLMGMIKEWDLTSGKELRTLDAKALHTYEGGQQVDFGGVRSLAISPDGASIAAGGLHKATNPLGAVHEPLTLVFDATTGKPARTLLADGITQGVIWRLRYLSDGTLMAGCGGGSGGFLLFWKPGAPKDVHRFALPNIVRDMDLHPDGVRIATAHHDGTVRITLLIKGAAAKS
jgi:WD40 repeat protein